MKSGSNLGHELMQSADALLGYFVIMSQARSTACIWISIFDLHVADHALFPPCFGYHTSTFPFSPPSLRSALTLKWMCFHLALTSHSPTMSRVPFLYHGILALLDISRSIFSHLPCASCFRYTWTRPLVSFGYIHSKLESVTVWDSVKIH